MRLICHSDDRACPDCREGISMDDCLEILRYALNDKIVVEVYWDKVESLPAVGSGAIENSNPNLLSKKTEKSFEFLCKLKWY